MARRASVRILAGFLVGLGLAAPAAAEPTLSDILTSLYGSGNFVEVSNDEVWSLVVDPATASAEAKFAGNSQQFGVLGGATILTVSSNCGPGSSACPGAVTFTTPDPDFRFALTTTGGSGTNTWSSDPAENSDASDHMRTFLVPSNPTLVVVAWEDLANLGDSDFNDLVVELDGVARVVCGDGVTSGSEECDDGNTADGDCCSSACVITDSLPECCLGEIADVVGTPGDDVVDLSSVQGCEAGGCSFAGGGGNDSALGTPGDDALCGGDGDDTLTGGPGDDILVGGAGNDTLIGESGNDRLDGSDGNDELLGKAGDDILRGQNGDDTLLAADGNDVLEGGAGDDDLLAGGGNDSLDGGPGMDQLSGDTGDDFLVGGTEVDNLLGGSGNDCLDAGAGLNETCNGGRGKDDSINCEVNLRIENTLGCFGP